MTNNTMRLETLASAIADFNSTVEAFNFWSVDSNEAWRDYDYYMDASRFEDDDEDYYGFSAEYRKWERDTIEWLRNHSGNPADPNYSEIYSDVYKDLYGVRPRW